MKNRRLQVLLIAITVLALGAGMAAGLLTSRLPAAGGTQRPDPLPIERTPLVEELGLSPEQREQMRLIWEDVRSRVHTVFDDAQQLQKRRDDAMVALLNDEQKAKFERISKEYADRFAELSQQRERAFQEAVEKTKMLLDEKQRAKYEQILKTQVSSASTTVGQ